jgi:large subunit GTPase 1
LNAKELQEARRAAEEAARRAAEDEAVGDDGTDDDGDVETVHGSQDATSSDEDISKVARAEAESQAMDQDPRTRILNVLELESLFISSAPDLDRELPSS